MKKKGFTLIELLAVIVILSIIALIAIPLIGNVIEKAKIGALENSVNGLVESANMYYANQSIKGENPTETIFDFANGEQTSTEKLEYKGKVYNGKLILHANGEVAVCIDDKEHYAYKNKTSDEIISGVGTCLYDGTTGDFSSNSSINDLRGKTVVATNITQSADGLSSLIKIPEEGHYDETSYISVLNSDLKLKVKTGTIQKASTIDTIECGFKPLAIIFTSIGSGVNNVAYIADEENDTYYMYGVAGGATSRQISLGNTDSYCIRDVTDTGFTVAHANYEFTYVAIGK